MDSVIWYESGKLEGIVSLQAPPMSVGEHLLERAQKAMSSQMKGLGLRFHLKGLPERWRGPEAEKYQLSWAFASEYLSLPGGDRLYVGLEVEGSVMLSDPNHLRDISYSVRVNEHRCVL